jgi:hypothetical protein
MPILEARGQRDTLGALAAERKDKAEMVQQWEKDKRALEAELAAEKKRREHAEAVALRSMLEVATGPTGTLHAAFESMDSNRKYRR